MKVYQYGSFESETDVGDITSNCELTAKAVLQKAIWGKNGINSGCT